MVLGKLFGRSDSAPDDMFSNLRQQALNVRPEEIGLPPSADTPIFGIMMDTGYDDVVATFLCFADRTVSLYLSSGGGVIGAGEHDSVWEAGQELLELTNRYAKEYIAACSSGPQRDLPQRGQVHFHLLTHSGVFSVRCKESELVEREDPFANLFVNCHEVLTEVRVATQSREAN
jgi:hypothetical protein